jgi:hypothetical protein
MSPKKEFEEDKQYYLENSKVVFTELYHVDRGFCCGSKCRHCPFDPMFESGQEKIREEFAHLKR